MNNSSNQAHENEFSQEIDSLHYLKVILHYWWFIGPFSLAGAGIMFLYSLSLPQKYRAECRFEIYENQKVQIAGDIGNDYNYWEKNPMDKHILMLRSSKLNDPITSDMLKKYPELENIKLAPFTLNLNPVKESDDDVIDISVDSFNNQAALEYLKILIKNFEKSRIESNSFEIESTKADLEEEIDKLDVQIEEVEKKIIEFKTKNNFVFVSTKTEFDQKYIGDLLEKANQNQFIIDIIKPELERLDSKPEAATEIFDQIIEVIAQSNNRYKMNKSGLELDIQQWKERKLKKYRLEAKLKIMLKKYKNAHPKIIAVNEELELIIVELEVYKKNIINSLKGQVKTLETQNKNYAADQIEDTFGQNAGIISQLEGFTNQAAKTK